MEQENEIVFGFSRQDLEDITREVMEDFKLEVLDNLRAEIETLPKTKEINMALDIIDKYRADCVIEKEESR